MAQQAIPINNTYFRYLFMLLVKSDANLDKITGKTSEFQQINAIKPLGEFQTISVNSLRSCLE